MGGGAATAAALTPWSASSAAWPFANAARSASCASRTCCMSCSEFAMVKSP